MNLILISNIVTCVFAFAGFIYGIIKFFKPKKALYAQMITLGVGCMAFGRLYQVVRLLTGGEILGEFQLGILGAIGSLVFFFSANFGLMDSLADDGSKEYRKYRIIPLVAPVAMLLIFIIFILLPDTSMLSKITGAVITLFVINTTYFNLKHLIFPDVDFGIINCLKAYNVAVIVYSFLCMAELVAVCREVDVAIAVTGILMGAVLLVIVPLVERGIKKWTT